MFGNNTTSGKKETTSKSTSAAPSGHALNSIVQGTSIEGTINAKSDIRIDGNIKGKLFCDAKLIVGPTGSVKGEVRCANAVIEGKVEGTLEVKEMLNVREAAHVKGEISYGKLIVQSGGVIDGHVSQGSLKKSFDSKSEQKAAKVAG